MKKIVIIFLLILVISALMLSSFYYIPVMQLPFLSLEDFVKVEVSAEGQTIYLTSNCHQLQMITSKDQVNSIRNGLENIRYARPNTHDLIKDTYKLFGVEVLMVKIVSIQANTYYAKLFLRQGNKILSLDSRPSDAIAIAVRMQAPVWAKEDLLVDYGKRVC